mgnify:CR=1 FL=1
MTESPVVRLPPRFLASLSELCGRAGPDAASALREAGRELGESLVTELPDRFDPAAASPDEFWEAASGLLAERGLGRLEVDVRTPSVAELRLEGSPEAAGTEDGEAPPSCHFATGLLAGLLTAAADEPVPVLQMTRAADDGGACRWLAGPEPSLEEVRGSLEEGASVREALETP